MLPILGIAGLVFTIAFTVDNETAQVATFLTGMGLVLAQLSLLDARRSVRDGFVFRAQDIEIWQLQYLQHVGEAVAELLAAAEAAEDEHDRTYRLAQTKLEFALAVEPPLERCRKLTRLPPRDALVIGDEALEEAADCLRRRLAQAREREAADRRHDRSVWRYLLG